jgi:hypothetical protein
LFIISPILSTPPRFSNSPALRQTSFDNLHPWNQNDILSGEFYVDRSSPTPCHDFIRYRSNIPLLTCNTRKSTEKILKEKDHSSSISNIKEKKFITSHSMMNSNMQSSPTAIVKNIHQTYRLEKRIMATTSINNIKKPVLSIRSPENSSRNVRFVPEIIVDDEQVIPSRIFSI